MSRQLIRKQGSEGPRHDPYAYVEQTVVIDGMRITLHLGLGTWLKVDGEFVSKSEWSINHFEMMTGLTPAMFEKYYDRLNPYYEDPMGSIGNYI